MIQRSQITRGLRWHTTSMVAQAIAQVAVLAVLARLLEPESFGLIAMAGVAVAFGQLLSEAGAAAAIVQRREPLDQHFLNAAFCLSLAIGATLALLQSFSATTLERLLLTPGLAPILIALSLTFVVTAFSRIPEAILQRDMRFRALMLCNVSTYIVGYSVTAIALAAAGFGAWALVAGTLMQALLKALALFAITRVRPAFRTTRAALHELLNFGAGMTAIKFLNYVMQQADKLLIGRSLDSAALGQFQVVTQLARMPGQYAGNVLDGVFYPVLSRLQGDHDRLSSTYVSLLAYSFFALFTLGIFMYANSQLLIEIVLGPQWLSSAPIFEIFCLGAGFRMAARVADTVNRALGQLAAAVKRKAILSALFVIGLVVSLPYGLASATGAIVTVQLIGAVILTRLAWKGIGVTWKAVRTPFFRLALACIIAVALNVALAVHAPHYLPHKLVTLLLSCALNFALVAFYCRPLIIVAMSARS